MRGPGKLVATRTRRPYPGGLGAAGPLRAAASWAFFPRLFAKSPPPLALSWRGWEDASLEGSLSWARVDATQGPLTEQD